MSQLTIRLFGSLEVERSGQPLPRLPSGRVKDLLIYLLLTPDVQHPRDQLAGLFWGDLEEEKARHCLNTTLWRLQRLLGQPVGTPLLRVSAQHLGLSLTGDVRLDVAEFERCCDWAERLGPSGGDQRAALCRQAMEAYRGDLLPECYEDWCVAERERLHGRYLWLLGQLQAYHTARGEHAAAIECARRVLASDPLREDVRRDLIKLHLAAGQPAAALAAYRHGEAVVRRELGSDLLPETRSLLGIILRAREGPRASAPGDLQEALARLRDAAASFDRAGAQLRRALALLDAMVQGPERADGEPAAVRLLGGAASTLSSLARDDQDQPLEAALVGVATTLATVVGGDRCAPFVSAAR